MSELTEFLHGQIVGDRMVCAFVSKVAEVFGILQVTVSKIMIKYRKTGKHLTSSSEDRTVC